MPDEPLTYRARKWVVQTATQRLKRPDQHRRLAEADWDVLVVLDACRWDALQRVTAWPLESARSPGSATDEWLAVAEETGVLRDAYVASANVKYSFFDVGEAELARLWETDWNNRLGTVLPEPVLDRAGEFLNDGQRPVVAHLLPPHAPYVARVGDAWLPAFPETRTWQRGADGERVSAQVAMASGEIDLDRARRSYEASVESTWETVADYVGRWVADGHDVVVTADHGEVFGRLRDFGLCGHPNRCHIDPLVKVPFERFSYGATDRDDYSVEEKLQALGYVE